MPKLQVKKGTLSLDPKSRNTFTLAVREPDSEGAVTLSRDDVVSLIDLLRSTADLREDGSAEEAYTVTEAAQELELSPNAVRKAAQEGRLDGFKNSSGWMLYASSVKSYPARTKKRGGFKAAPMLTGKLGSAAGISFRVKAANRVDISKSKKGEQRITEFEVQTFQRVAIAFSGKQMNRCFYLEPAARASSYEHGPFFIEGKFKIVEKFNEAKLASLAFKDFEAE